MFSGENDMAEEVWTDTIDVAPYFLKWCRNTPNRRVSGVARDCSAPLASSHHITRRCIPRFTSPFQGHLLKCPRMPFYICCPTIHRSVSNVVPACPPCYVRFTFAHFVEHLSCSVARVWLVESLALVGLSTGEPGQRCYRR
jgi:hypothetical protein